VTQINVWLIQLLSNHILIFKGIDWEKLVNKEIPPPFIPPVKGASDTSMVDPIFTSEKPTLEDDDSDPASALSPEKQQQFVGFTFVPEEKK